MAKYGIDYACGHGSHTEQLYGKHDERARRIEWAEANIVCPECYRAKMATQRQAEKLTAEVIYNAFSGGVWLAVTKGDTYSIKDSLKAIGCRWREYSANGDILGMGAPKKAWMLFVGKTPEAADFGATLQVAMDQLSQQGIVVAALDTSPLATISYVVAADLAKGA